jgi:hypothetical protein
MKNPERAMSELSEDNEFSAKVPDAAIQQAIKASVPKFGPPGYHLTIEVARILGVGPDPAFRRPFWRNAQTLGYAYGL